MAREHPRGFLSVERVKERLSLLRDAGVQGMYFSVDAFHQEFVRAECVCRGIRFAREIFGDDRVVAPRVTKEAARDLEGPVDDHERLPGYTRSRRLRLLGRASDELAQFHPPIPLKELMAENCRQELDIDELAEVQVDPLGHVRPDWCLGVNFGNGGEAPYAGGVSSEAVPFGTNEFLMPL